METSTILHLINHLNIRVVILSGDSKPCKEWTPSNISTASYLMTPAQKDWNLLIQIFHLMSRVCRTEVKFKHRISLALHYLWSFSKRVYLYNSWRSIKCKCLIDFKNSNFYCTFSDRIWISIWSWRRYGKHLRLFWLILSFQKLKVWWIRSTRICKTPPKKWSPSSCARDRTKIWVYG